MNMLKVDYAIAYARTVAGVHYQMNNIAGLKLEQDIVARLLPNFINENMGLPSLSLRKRKNH
jgi:hypothetical protein